MDSSWNLIRLDGDPSCVISKLQSWILFRGEITVRGRLEFDLQRSKFGDIFSGRASLLFEHTHGLCSDSFAFSIDRKLGSGLTSIFLDDSSLDDSGLGVMLEPLDSAFASIFTSRGIQVLSSLTVFTSTFRLQGEIIFDKASFDLVETELLDVVETELLDVVETELLDVVETELLDVVETVLLDVVETKLLNLSKTVLDLFETVPLDLFETDLLDSLEALLLANMDSFPFLELAVSFSILTVFTSTFDLRGVMHISAACCILFDLFKTELLDNEELFGSSHSSVLISFLGVNNCKTRLAAKDVMRGEAADSFTRDTSLSLDNNELLEISEHSSVFTAFCILFDLFKTELFDNEELFGSSHSSVLISLLGVTICKTRLVTLRGEDNDWFTRVTSLTLDNEELLGFSHSLVLISLLGVNIL